MTCSACGAVSRVGRARLPHLPAAGRHLAAPRPVRPPHDVPVVPAPGVGRRDAPAAVNPSCEHSPPRRHATATWPCSCWWRSRASGVPLPGETTLVAAATYAGGRIELSVWGIFAVAAAAAVLGDTAGYWIGDKGGYRLLRRWGRYVRFDEPKVKVARYLFDRHGAKVVFFGRFVSVLRTYAAFLAGTVPHALPTLPHLQRGRRGSSGRPSTPSPPTRPAARWPGCPRRWPSPWRGGGGGHRGRRRRRARSAAPAPGQGRSGVPGSPGTLTPGRRASPNRPGIRRSGSTR